MKSGSASSRLESGSPGQTLFDPDDTQNPTRLQPYVGAALPDNHILDSHVGTSDSDAETRHHASLLRLRSYSLTTPVPTKMPPSFDTPARPESRARRLTNKLSFSNASIKSATGSLRSSHGKDLSASRSSNQGLSSQNEATASDGNTIAQLYAVFGLPKDPAVWTLAEEDCVSGVHHIEGAVGRFWRPEVLGCSICPPTSEQFSPNPAQSPASPKRQDDNKAGSDKKNANPKFIEMSDGRGGIERAETARVLSKALKLSFTREIEVTSGPGNFPPSSASHTFSFSVPSIRSSPTLAIRKSADVRSSAAKLGVTATEMHKSNTSAVGEGFGLQHSRGTGAVNGSGGEDTTGVATFYGSVLTVWSAADEKRAKAIKKELAKAAKARATGVNGRIGNNGEDIDANDDALDPNGASQGYTFLPENNTFFMPYAICIVSRFPIYNLLGDWNKAAWHKYSRNIEMHNKLMSAILRQPAPRVGETFKVKSPDEDLAFVCTFPGAIEWGRGLVSIDFPMWPLFKTLSIDNIITICEIALAPAGRVLFLSRHPALLGMAVETIKYLVELCGWKGLAHQNCHARDVKIYLEDPGSWLIAINTELRSIAKPAKEVCVVDLDINFVNCPSPPAKAPSTRAARDKKRRKIIAALGFSSGDYTPPREFVDAFPAGRFRPLCQVQSKSGLPTSYESLDAPHWWNEGHVISAFDQVLHEGTKPTFLKKVLKRRVEKQYTVSETERAAILALRRRASTFVDARDGLENKIGRLNKRLAFLISEGEMWRQQFDKIQQLVDRLTREANDLRIKVDKERRESRRLSSTLQQRDMEQVQLQLQLRETEQAREKAQGDLQRMREAMDSLENEREAMMDEIRNIVSTSRADDFDFSSLSKLETMATDSAAVERWNRTESAMSDVSHNSELSILRSRALAEQRISMGRPRTNSALQKSSSLVGSRLGHASQNGHTNGDGQNDASLSSQTQHQFGDDQINQEIQSRTSAVTDQIARIQQQLESTLTNLEGRRSGTFERSRDRRRLSNSSMASSSYHYEHGGPPSSLGHYGGGAAASASGHGTEIEDGMNGKAKGSAAAEEVESIQDNIQAIAPMSPDGRNARRFGRAPSTRGQDPTTPKLTAKHPDRARAASITSPVLSPRVDSEKGDAADGAKVTPAQAEAEANGNGISKSETNYTLAPEDQKQPASEGAVSAPVAAGAAVGVAAVAAGSAAVVSTKDDNKVAAETDKAGEKDLPAPPADSAGAVDEQETADAKKADADDVSKEDEGDSSEGEMAMFEEPDDFRPKTPPPTQTFYEFPGTDTRITLNLVGSHPLWGHLAWNASFVMADFICAHADMLARGKSVLELGAAAGLPSIVAHWAEADHMVATDYPDPDLLSNLRSNVELNCKNSQFAGPGDAHVEGFIWGTDPSELLGKLPEGKRFDLILLSDLVFNHQAHPALLDTCDRCLSEEAVTDELSTPCVLVFFTHHRPHLAYKDMAFFDMAEVKGWKHEKLGEWYREPMFPDDPGDEQVRSTIHGFRLWRAGNDDDLLNPAA